MLPDVTSATIVDISVVQDLKDMPNARVAVVSVTNQPDVASGDQPRSVVESMNDVVRVSLDPDSIMVCYQGEADRCECRKPAPGVLLAAGQELGLDPARSFIVGNRWRDIERGVELGA